MLAFNDCISFDLAHMMILFHHPDLETDGGEEEREVWGSKWEFIFSCVGLSVGIGGISSIINRWH